MTKELNKNLIGIYLLLSCLIFILISALGIIIKSDLSIIILVSSAGGLGATLYAMRGFYQHIAANDFDGKWIWWYIIRPLQGILAGIFTYLFIVGGLIGLENTDGNKIYLIISLSFIAGYGFTQFANSIISLGKKGIQ